MTILWEEEEKEEEEERSGSLLEGGLRREMWDYFLYFNCEGSSKRM